MFSFQLQEGDFDLRLDQILARNCPEMSRIKARKLLSEGAVFINGTRCKTASRTFKKRVTISVAFEVLQWTSNKHDDQRALCAAVEVIAQTEELVVIVKPAGLHTQGTKLGDRYTVTTAVAEKLKCPAHQLHLVHRLDQETSGLMVLARTSAAAAHLSQEMRLKKINREYVALVHGAISGTRSVDAPIEEKKSGVRRKALTHIKALPLNNDVSLVHAVLETGRTHQVRIHLASLGHPVCGDSSYGSTQGKKGLALHAAKLQFAGNTYVCEPPNTLCWELYHQHRSDEHVRTLLHDL